MEANFSWIQEKVIIYQFYPFCKYEVFRKYNDLVCRCIACINQMVSKHQNVTSHCTLLDMSIVIALVDNWEVCFKVFFLFAYILLQAVLPMSHNT